MPINYTSLRQELDDDPLDFGYVNYLNSGNHVDVATLLNQKNYIISDQYVLIKDVQSYVDTNNLRVGVYKGITNNELPEQIRDVCQSVKNMFEARYEYVDITNETFLAGIDALCLVGLLTTDNKSGIIAIGDKPASRADVLFGYPTTVSHIDIAEAMRS
jgi:hypothetical protein